MISATAGGVMRIIGRIAAIFTALVLINGATIILTEYGHEDSHLPPPQEVVIPPERIDLLFAGDLMAHDVNFNMADYTDIYQEMKPTIEHADLAFINLETPVYEKVPYTSFPRFNVHQDYVQAAVDAGFDIFALANNHSADQEAPGIIATLELMRKLAAEEGIAYSGLRMHQRSPITPTTVKAGNWSIGFISITSFINVWSGHELIYLTDYYRNEALRKEFLDYIRTIKPLYQILVIAVHDGAEYSNTPLERKKVFFRELAEAGADVVWGNHSHVLQPWERFTKIDGTSAVLIYSMGNFISGQTWNIDPADYKNEKNATGDSCLLNITFTKEPGKRAISRSITPYLAFNYRDPVKGMIVRPYDKIIGDEGVPKAWKDFYRERKRLLSWFLRPDQPSS